MKQIRKPFNIVMALILLIVVTIATIAFSSWLITDEITEKPIYQPGTVAKYYLDNQKILMMEQVKLQPHHYLLKMNYLISIEKVVIQTIYLVNLRMQGYTIFVLQ